MLNDEVKGMLSSKKFRAAVAATVVAAAAKLGLDIDPVTVGLLIAPLLTYIFSQGQTDKGKVAAAIQAEATAIQTQGAEKVARIEAAAAIQAVRAGQSGGDGTTPGATSLIDPPK